MAMLRVEGGGMGLVLVLTLCQNTYGQEDHYMNKNHVCGRCSFGVYFWFSVNRDMGGLECKV